MAESVCKVEYYSAVIPHQCGEGAKLLAAMKDAGVSFIGLWAYPLGDGNVKVDMVAEDAAVLKQAAKKLKVKLGAKQVAFYVYGRNRKGAVADAVAKLAEAGVNLRALQAACAGKANFGAFIQLENAADVKKAAKALGI